MDAKIEIHFLHAADAPITDAYKNYLHEMIACHELMIDWQNSWKELELCLIRHPDLIWSGKSLYTYTTFTDGF